MYYQSIKQLPLTHWDECHTGNLTYTRIDQEKGTQEEDLKAWDVLIFDYLELFGVNVKQQHYIHLEQRKTLLQLEIIETGNRFLLNEINEIEAELIEFRQNALKEAQSTEEILWEISKIQGYTVKKTDLTTFEYLTFLRKNGKKD
jgi:hypothetical protein